ncbi:MAG: hypothetical protein ACI4RV_04440 [Eubacteriales bacterium]
MTLEAFVWIIFFAIVAAVVYTFFMQRSVNGLAARLMDCSADCPERAKTLQQLGYRRAAVRSAVAFFARGGSPVARAIVKSAPSPQNAAQSELLFRQKPTVTYYIPEENQTKTFRKHASEQMPVLRLCGVLLLLCAAAFLGARVIRFLGDWATGMVTSESNRVVGTEDTEPSLLDEQEQLNQEAQKPENDAQDGEAEADDEQLSDAEENPLPEVSENVDADTAESVETGTEPESIG